MAKINRTKEEKEALYTKIMETVVVPKYAYMLNEEISFMNDSDFSDAFAQIEEQEQEKFEKVAYAVNDLLKKMLNKNLFRIIVALNPSKPNTALLTQENLPEVMEVFADPKRQVILAFSMGDCKTPAITDIDSFIKRGPNVNDRLKEDIRKVIRIGKASKTRPALMQMVLSRDADVDYAGILPYIYVVMTAKSPQ